MKKLGMHLMGIAAVLFLSHCGREDNPTITLKFGSYTAMQKLFNFFIPEAQAAVANARVCFKRLRFKQATGENSSDTGGSDNSANVDFEPGDVVLSAASTTLGDVQVAAGEYRRLEFDLQQDGRGCTSGRSVELTNDNGTFAMDQSVTIVFEGQFTAESSGQVLQLGVQNIIDALNAVTADAEIKSRLEDASLKGTF